MFHSIVRITLFGSGEISSADHIGEGPGLIPVSIQSSLLLSHLVGLYLVDQIESDRKIESDE